MEAQSDYGNTQMLMSFNFSGNIGDDPYGVGDDPNQSLVTADGNTEPQPNALTSPPWFRCPKTPLNYFEFLTENSTFLEKASAGDVLGSIPPPVGSPHVVEGVCDAQRALQYNTPGMACGFKSADSTLDMDAREWKPYFHLLSSDNHEASLNASCPQPHYGGELLSKFESSQHKGQAQIQNSWTEEPSKDFGNFSRIYPRVTVAPSVFLSKQHDVSRDKLTKTDREHRERIALKALQELLPHSVEGSQAVVLDEVIDHIKYLQLQMRELTQRRLRAQSTALPLLLLEGYGHYAVHEKMSKAPLEEMIGKLLEVNPPAATKLLQRKGLFLMPMALVDRLQQALSDAQSYAGIST